MNTVLAVFIAALGAAATVAAYALIRMSRPMEKMVALDVLTTIVTGVLLLTAVLAGNVMVLDIALVYAVLSFGAVMLVARYRERGL